jgi:hypothetical protein
MDILPKAAKVNGAATDLCSEYVQLTLAAGFVGQCQAVDDAGFAGAVGAEDEGNGPNRDVLGFGERFEIAEMEIGEHVSSLLTMLFSYDHIGDVNDMITSSNYFLPRNTRTTRKKAKARI